MLNYAAAMNNQTASTKSWPVERWLRAIATPATVLVLVFSAICNCTAIAQAYPVKPIRLIVPFPPGGPADIASRIIGKKLSEALGQQMILENRAGAGGTIALELAAKATADGYTLVLGSLSTLSIAPIFNRNLSYDPVKSFAPVAFAGAVPMLVIVSPDYPAKTLAELIARAKTDKLSYASAGAGSTMHIIGEMINAEAGIKTTHVPYKGVAPALNDLLGGHIQLLSADLPVLEPLVKSGKVRALALFAAERSPLLPDVPTSAELGYPRMLMNNWYGMLAPAGTPAGVQASLEKAMLEAMKSPAISQRLAAGGVHGATDGKGFRERLEREVAFWGPQLKKLGINGE